MEEASAKPPDWLSLEPGDEEGLGVGKYRVREEESASAGGPIKRPPHADASAREVDVT